MKGAYETNGHSSATNASVHCRSITNSTSPSPLTKRVKEDLTVSLGSTQADATTKTKTKVAITQATGGWGNFAAYIAQDDKSMAVKAREDFKRLGGETFRPEFRETYKDQKGEKQIVVHDKVGGSANEAITAKSKGKGEAAVNEEKDTGGDAVVLNAYDTDSSDGGVALSPSHLKTDSWVVIKTGGGDKSWKRK